MGWQHYQLTELLMGKTEESTRVEVVEEPAALTASRVGVTARLLKSTDTVVVVFCGNSCRVFPTRAAVIVWESVPVPERPLRLTTCAFPYLH